MDFLKSDTIKKVFGAAVPGRTYEQHFGQRAESMTEALAPSHYDLWWGLLDQLGDYDLSLIHCRPGSITLLEQMWDRFVAEYWPEARKKYADAPNSYQRADVMEQFFERYDREIRTALFGSDIQWWDVKKTLGFKPYKTIATPSADDAEAEKGPFNFTWISNTARQIFNGLFQGNPSAEANAAFEAFLDKDLREAWRVEDNKGLDYPAETMEWLPNTLYKLAGQHGANVGPTHKTGDA